MALGELVLLSITENAHNDSTQDHKTKSHSMDEYTISARLTLSNKDRGLWENSRQSSIGGCAFQK